MKNFLIAIGSEILRTMIAAQSGATSSSFGSLFAAPRASAPMPDFNYLTQTGKRIFALTAVGFLCSLFLAFGTMMALGAVAQSFDLFGVFVAGAVFYTGFFVALVSAVGLIACIAKGRKIAFSWERFFHGAPSMSTEMEAYAPVVTEASRPEMRPAPASSTASPVPSAAPSATVPFTRTGGINNTDAIEPTARPDSERMAS